MTDLASFDAAHLRPELKAALAAAGLTTPTPVQAACLAAGLGQDLVVQARTGSGKTLAFGLPILDGLPAEARAPQALVLAPTRELALQIAKALGPMAEAAGARCVALTGGAGYGLQLAGLRDRRGAQLVVGTPGRVRDHLERGTFPAAEVKVAVLDEADQLLDLGFKDDLEAIIGKLPPERRTLLFSATIPPEVDALARRATRDARWLVLDGGATPHADIEHLACAAPVHRKAEALANLLLYERPERTVVFCATRHGARDLSEQLPLLGIPAALISGELDQAARNRALDAFRAGRCHVLVATDVAARGIDVPATTHVVHASLPGTHEAYVHRSGRTGRAGRQGVAISLVAPAERPFFAHLTKRAGVKVRWFDPPGPEGIRRRRVARLADRLLAEAGAGDVPPSPEAVKHARRLAQGLGLAAPRGDAADAAPPADAGPLVQAPPADAGPPAQAPAAEATPPLAEPPAADAGPAPPRAPARAPDGPGLSPAAADLVARLLDAAAALEGDPGFDLSDALKAEAAAAAERARAGPRRDGRARFARQRERDRRGGRPPGPPGRDDHGPRDRGPPRGPRDDHGPRDHGPRDRGPPRGPRDHGPRDHGPRDHGPRDRGPPQDRPAPRPRGPRPERGKSGRRPGPTA